MSRDHAELVFNPETEVIYVPDISVEPFANGTFQTIYITDVGSMHGTILNGRTLVRNEAVELADGDNLSFGTEVRRGQETFPPCSFQVHLEYSPYRATNTYAVPSSSELDDGEELDMSDDNSDDDVSSISSRPKVSQPIDAIDLTRDESPISSSASIDADGADVVMAIKLSELTALNNEAVRSVSCDAPNARKERQGYGMPDVEDHSDSESDEEPNLHSEDESIPHFPHDIDGRSPVQIEIQDSEDEEMEDNEDGYSEPEPEEEESFIGEVEMEKERVIPETQLYQEPYSPVLGLSETIGGDSVVETYRPSHLTDLYPAMVETMQTMFDAELDSSRLPIGSAHAIRDNEATESEPLLERREYSSLQLRQPSPSDAAMAKPLETKIWHPSSMDGNDTKPLGDGTGKEAFFRAREENKALLQRTEQNNERDGLTTSVYQLQPTTNSLNQNPQLPLPQQKACDVRLHEGMQTSRPQISHPLDESALHIIGSSNDVILQLPLSYSESLSTSIVQPFRPALRIADIIDKSPPEQVLPRHKRKADEISDAVEDEVRAWTTAPEASFQSITREESFDPKTSIPVVTANKTNSTRVEAMSVNTRPTKKLRRMMENVAYAALGGVAVGAALFGGLVATAPDLL